MNKKKNVLMVLLYLVIILFIGYCVFIGKKIGI